MGRIMAIDWGSKRVGLAVTDPDQIIATGLTTVHIANLMSYIKTYCSSEEVSQFVVGDPKHLDNSPTEISARVKEFVVHLKRTFPEIPVDMIDERYTSKMAEESIQQSVPKKSARRNKELIDEVSATIILQSFMNKKI
jgi:putative Holliday junction resolvase